MKKNQDSGRSSRLSLGPSISAVPLWGTSARRMIPLLTDKDRAHLAKIASVVRFGKNEEIQVEGERATAVLNIRDGVVKTWKTSSDGRRHVLAFLFPGDLIGLAEEGRYANSATAITEVAVYRLPIPALETLLKKDALIEFQVIAKLGHSLRAAQRHALFLCHRNPINKLVLFLQLIEEYQLAHGHTARQLYLPMSRNDIANYLDLKPETLSRAFAALRRKGVIAVTNKRHLTITNRERFAAVLGTPGRALTA